MARLPQKSDARFDSLVHAFCQHEGVTPPDTTRVSRRFGSNALKIHNKIFALLTGDRLVLKLPRARVDALVASKEGERFDPGHGRAMKEWIVVSPSCRADWLLLAREAMAFTATKQ